MLIKFFINYLLNIQYTNIFIAYLNAYFIDKVFENYSSDLKQLRMYYFQLLFSG